MMQRIELQHFSVQYHIVANEEQLYLAFSPFIVIPRQNVAIANACQGAPHRLQKTVEIRIHLITISNDYLFQTEHTCHSREAEVKGCNVYAVDGIVATRTRGTLGWERAL